MKLAGIDGADLRLVRNCRAFRLCQHPPPRVLVRRRRRPECGLEFAVCYEDQTIPKLVEAGKVKPDERVEHARREIDWLRKNWFGKPSYLKLDSRPVLLSFGRDGLTESEW